MYETPDDLADLDLLLSRSLEGASEHLRSIISRERQPSAQDLVDRLDGMRVLALATVSGAGRPRISAVDGHFLRGHWVFSTSATSVKAMDLRQRPALSAAHLEGELLGVFTHGEAEFLDPGHRDRAWVDSHLTHHYGSSPLGWGAEIVYVRVRPRWMVAFAQKPGAEASAPPPPG